MSSNKQLTGIKLETEALGYLGEDYQYRIVKTFFEDHHHFKNVLPFIDQNDFSIKHLRTIVGTLKDVYSKDNFVPSYEFLCGHMGTILKNDIELEEVRETIKLIKSTSVEGQAKVKETIYDFSKQQAWIRLSTEIQLKIINGSRSIDELGVEDRVRKILNIGNVEKIWTTVFEDFENTISPDYKIPIPLGIGEIDEYLDGGIPKGNLALCCAGTGIGKAQPLREILLTPNGYVRMGDIKVGDKVIGSNGKPISVTGVFPQGVRDVYRVYFKDGTYTDCDYEHLWNVNSHYQRNAHKFIKGRSYEYTTKNGTKRMKRFKSQDLSYKTMTLKEICDKQLIRWDGRLNFRIPTLSNPVEFNKKYNNIDPYVMGCFIGKDKSEDKYIPSDYLYTSTEDRIALLQGLMDSDGTCDKNGRVAFSTKSEQLANDMKQLVLSLGGYVRITSKKRGYFNKKYNEYRDCGIHYNVQFSLCDENIKIFRLKRKQDRVIYRDKYREDKYIKSVEYIGKEECQCIMVDATDSLYITKDYIVTHNTTISTSIAAHASTYRCDNNNNEGFRVLQIFFEDRHKSIKRKHIGNITGIEARNLSKDEYVDKVKNIVEVYEDRELIEKNLLLGKFRSGDITVTQLKNHIDRIVEGGFKPDVILIDYFECLKNPPFERGGSEWSAETQKMRQLENLCDDYDCLVFVTTQGTKESAQGMLLTLDKISGSAGKSQAAHFIMTINKTDADKENNRATIYIPKYREGASGKTFFTKFNNGTCRIEVEKSFDSIDTLKENMTKKAEELKTQTARDYFKNKKNNTPINNNYEVPF